jgi:hypothetical protein
VCALSIKQSCGLVHIVSAMGPHNQVAPSVNVSILRKVVLVVPTDLLKGWSRALRVCSWPK